MDQKELAQAKRERCRKRNRRNFAAQRVRDIWREHREELYLEQIEHGGGPLGAELQFLVRVSQGKE